MKFANMYFTRHVFEFPFGPSNGGVFVWNSDRLFVKYPDGVSIATSKQIDEFSDEAKRLGEYDFMNTDPTPDQLMKEVANRCMYRIVPWEDETERGLMASLFEPSELDG